MNARSWCCCHTCIKKRWLLFPLVHISLGAVITGPAHPATIRQFVLRTLEQVSRCSWVLLVSQTNPQCKCEAPNTLARLTVQRSIDLPQVRPMVVHPPGVRLGQLDSQVLE